MSGMADLYDSEDHTVEGEEECFARHRKEKKELQVEIQKLKHSVPKGDKKKKKEITAQIAVLDAELEERHEQELKELRAKLMSVQVAEKSDSGTSVSDGLVDGISENSGDAEVSVMADKKPSKTQRRKDKKTQKQVEREERIRDQEILNESGARKVEAEKIKAALKARKLAIHEIPSDGNCLYAAIADQLRQQQIESSVQVLRCHAAEYLRTHPDEFLPFLVKEGTGDMYSQEEYVTYCQRVESTSEWGGHTEIRALSDVLGCPIEVVQADGANIVVGENLPGQKLILSYHRHAYGLGEHYNSVVPLEESKEDEGFS